MTEQEYNEELDKLNMQKKGFEGNRSLCAAVIVIVGFIAVKDDGLKTTPWYILAILCAVILTAGYILYKDSVKIKQIKNRIKDLELIDRTSFDSETVSEETSKEKKDEE